ncbi:MAG: hypothetical protein IJW24_00835, partial [Clostridia bacterium]|nr:hypothetical protein [Clostridia bacterium]
MFDKIKFKKTLIFVAVTFAIALFSLCSLISPLSSCGKHESDEGSAFSEGVFANSSSDVDIIISDTKFVNDTDGTMVTVSSGQHVVIDNCEFVGPLGVAVEVVGGEASVRNSTFSGFDGSAIIVGEADNVERCVLNVEGCSISNSKSSAICAINSDLIVSSTQFSGCNSVEGAAIYSQDSTILIGADAEITDCSAEKGGAFSFYDCEATLNGVAIERCNAENGGAIYLGEGVTLEVQNGNIASNSATNVGGGVFVGKSSTINVLGGNIALNTADVNGAGIYGAENSRIMLSGGYVVENSATRSGAGIFAAGAFEMTGGVVSKNITTSTKANKLSFGAGIHLASGTAATISGGQISENKSTYRGGGIFSLRELSIVGETIVYANTSEEDGAGIFSAGETTYIGTASCEFEGAISANVSQSNGGGVCANVGTVVHNSGIVGENTELNPLFVGNKASSGSGVGIYNGHYVLNGGQILKNVGTTSSAVGVAMSGASSFQMNSGLIEGNSTTNAGVMGSAVRVAGGTFTMNGGEIRNHQSLSGGAIYCSANFVMTGGVISGNTATQNGGAIFVTKATATVLISGGVLEGNVAGANGGAIYGDQSCVIDISNSSSTPASLSTNSAVLGGAVYVSNATLSMDDGVISSNSSSGGAGVYGDNGSVINVSGGVISLNSSSGDGAGIYGAEGSTINLSSNGRIYANVSAGNGAGICALGTFLMTGGSVVENKNTGTLALGGGIYLLSEAEKTISGGIVSKNESAYRGGGIYSTCSLSVVGDAVISGNTCKEDGAGVFVNGEITLNIGTDSALFEGVIAENRTSGLGGGIVGYNKANIIHNSGIIGSGKVGSSTYSGNLAGSGSAVGLWSGATYTMNGGTLCGNDGLSVNGSAIAISHDLSLITINSGTIEGNFSTTYSIDGGAIRIIAGSCVMNGGEIKGNVDNNRGAVYCSNGSFSMSGGTISGNVSINGGGIYVATNGVCEISGGVISGNTANNGGGIYFAEN